MHFVPPGVSIRKSAASNFLEYHFGWEPLVKDIYDALETYRDPIKTLHREKVSGHDSDQIFANGNQNFDGFDGSYWQQFAKIDRNVVVSQGVVLRGIKDQTSFSLEQWGVASPLSLAWEEVPFSFVVDWFANVGQVLQSGSSFAGLDLGHQFWSFTHRTSLDGSNRWVVQNHPSTYNNLSFYAIGQYSYREPNLWHPVFQIRNLKPPSVTRAATAISLLIQQMRR